jgi:hypothetical protein
MALIADYLDRMIVNTILVAVDGSIGFAHDHVSKVIVLAFSEHEEGGVPAAHDEARDSAYLIGECALNARIPCETNVLHSTQPAEEIVAEARRRHCDLIWLSAATEGTESAHCLDAAVAVDVLGRADVPVMLYRTRTGA